MLVNGVIDGLSYSHVVERLVFEVETEIGISVAQLLVQCDLFVQFRTGRKDAGVLDGAENPA